jgi:hypothetical protein
MGLRLQVRKDIRAERQTVKPSKRIASISPNKRASHDAYNRDARAFLAGKQCAVYPTLKAVEIHHTAGRLGPLLNDQSKWIAVSRQAHNWIHLNIAEARSFGWIAPVGAWNLTERTKKHLQAQAACARQRGRS